MTPDIILQRTGIDVRAVEQGDDAWHKLRLGVITASEVHNVIAKPRSGKKWPDMSHVFCYIATCSKKLSESFNLTGTPML